MGISSIDNVYISSACNRTPHSADWGRNNLVCFGSSHGVAIYDPTHRGVGVITRTLCYQKGRVNCVRWIRHYDGSPEEEFVSCSNDRSVVLWTKHRNGLFRVTTVLEGHADSVTVADGMYIDAESHDLPSLRKLIIVSGSVDSSVKIWLREVGEKQLTCFQTIDYGAGFSLCLRLCYLPGTKEILLLCAADDAKVHLYTSDMKRSFVKVHNMMGHEDWVQAIDVTSDFDGNLIIATGSQDAMIRLWQISPRKSPCNKQSHSMNEDLQPEERIFTAGDKHYAVTMESVLAGHYGWIYSVCWHVSSGERRENSLKLLSASLDKSIIVWSPDPETGMWLESVRVGDMGGNSLGFYGGMFSPDGLSILGHGYQGSFHLWSHCADTNIWEPKVSVGGHFDEVVDMQWDPNGLFLLSVSKDQTTRLHAPWVRSSKEITWHEIARPQIHGYDMTSLAVFSHSKFASGAEEKIVRAFQAPNNFIGNFRRLCNVQLDESESINVPRGASVPALGLSNKAVFENEELPEDRHVKDEFPAAYFVPVDLTEPPAEEHLMQNTLWPEVQKLYGHGYEIFSLAAHPSGSILASACKATNTEHAAIILWNTSTWQRQQLLVSHQLTVTQLAFSPNGKYLLSVSRDRLWSLFEETGNEYELVSKTSNKTSIHSRIIWTCAWSSDSECFATGSRDGKLCVWCAGRGAPKNLAVLDLKGMPITAVAFQPQLCVEKYTLAVGLESGEIILYSWSRSSDAWEKLHYLDRNDAHHLTVKRLAFSPTKKFYLASCGSDGSVKIHAVNVS